tara:strand:+ start:7415 stop:7750 length:336 start_codon:yes stop_codon:yes gene_type:complete
MARSKPIWNEVTSCTYKKSPSWGAINDCRTQTYTGSSASNSYILADVEISKKTYKNFIAFNFYIDGRLLKQNVHLINKGRAGSLIASTDWFKSLDFLNSENEHTHALNKAL